MHSRETVLMPGSLWVQAHTYNRFNYIRTYVCGLMSTAMGYWVCFNGAVSMTEGTILMMVVVLSSVTSGCCQVFSLEAPLFTHC